MTDLEARADDELDADGRAGAEGTSLPPVPLRDAFVRPLWDRLLALDRGVLGAGKLAPSVQRAAAARDPAPGDVRAAPQFDVALVGGGLHVVLAPLLVRRGLRVVVLERAQAARAHREWNASAGELQALVEVGLCTADELNALVLARYATGTCAWHNGGSYAVQGVLDCAVDAQALLDLARERARAQGVVFRDHTEVVGERGHAEGVTLTLRPTLGPNDVAPETLEVRAMVDARGAASPYCRADLVCPTVGGVLQDLPTGTGDRRRIDPTVGEILATTEDVEDGRQHIWEAFPGRRGQTAVYLFYYAPAGELPKAPLAQLYRRFCATLPRFKEGPLKLLRPTFGLIPGWSRLRPGSRSPHPRIVLVGDAASRHSPLTFCGFGAMLRSLPLSLDAIAQACRGEAPGAAVDDRPLHRLTGALATLIARPPPNAPARLNALLDHAFATLAQMGPRTYAGLLQDTLPPADAMRFLWRTSRRDPNVWRQVLHGLGAGRSVRWAVQSGVAALRG